jgi:hypothetical protein
LAGDADYMASGATIANQAKIPNTSDVDVRNEELAMDNLAWLSGVE